MTDIAGKTAIITGGAKGIGLAVARLFATDGAQVIIADCDEQAGKMAADTLCSEGYKVAFCRCDVSSAAEVTALLDYCDGRFGAPDIVVNGAAIQLNKPLLETTDDEFERVMAINLTGTFRLIRDAAKRMIAAKKQGVIVNFSSTFAIVGSPGYLAYHASKGAISSMTRAAAIALMPHGIRVNAIAPGTTDTPGLHDGARNTGNEEKGLQSFLALQPLKRFGQPEEIARAVRFLASDDSSFVIGATLVADGGYTIV